jgi:capsular polysaccharide biosynthesis protein
VISGEQDPDLLKVEEAFTLLGPQLGAFGDFMLQYLPRYVWASMSGALPNVPVLINVPIPATIEQAIAALLPEGGEIIKVRPFQPVFVERLWCASNLTYAPAREVMDERYSPDHTFPSPDMMVPVVREMKRRMFRHMRPQVGARKIFLARRPTRWRKLVNAPEIEAIAAEAGFDVVYPEELEFIEQVNLLANSSHVVAPEGSALFLCHFATPGTKVCILQHMVVEGTNVYDAMFDGCDFTLLTGPFERLDPVFPHRSDYLIDPGIFKDFIAGWVEAAR